SRSYGAIGVAAGGVDDRFGAFVDRPQPGVVAHKPEIAVAEAVEVFNDLIDSTAVGYADVGNVSPPRAHIVQDHRHTTCLEFIDQRRVHFGDDGGEAGNAAADHQPNAGDQLLGAVVRIRYHHFIPSGVGVAFHGFVDVEEERVLHIGDDHPEGPALPARQIA